MLDLSSFAEPILPDDPRLRAKAGGPPAPATVARQGVHWWLAAEDMEPDELLAGLLAAIQKAGWRRVSQEKMNFLLENRDGRLLVQVDDAPCREVMVRSASGKQHRIVRWPDAFEDRMVVLVKQV
jgi:hypothetical protein